MRLPSALLLASALLAGPAPLAQPVQPPSAQALVFTPAPGGGDSIYPALGDPGLDVLHYDLSLRVEAGLEGLAGQATLNVRALADLGQVNLDFSGPTVEELRLDGAPAPFRQEGGKLLVRPARPLRAGAVFTLTVVYSGAPGRRTDPDDGLRLGWITSGSGSYVLSEPDGAHTFFPCNDLPRDGASYQLHLDVPAGLTAVASGTLTGSGSAGGRATFDFELTQPIPSYALTVHIGRLELLTRPGPAGITLRDAYPESLPASLRAPFGRSGEMITALGSWFGPFPYPLYGVALTEDPGIPALETATLSTFPARLQGERVAAHELAHQWFGDSLRLGDWSEVWLNEGFATYAEQLWAEGSGGDGTESDGGLARRVQGWYDRLTRAPARGLVATRPAQLFDSSSYLRGALALHALRVAAGNAGFRAVLRSYVERYSGRSVRTADFLGVVSQVAGPAALEAMRPWVEGPALPPLPPAFLKAPRP